MTDTPQEQPVEIDAGAVLGLLEQTHPDAVRAAVWQVRARMAEAERDQLKAALEAARTE